MKNKVLNRLLDINLLSKRIVFLGTLILVGFILFCVCKYEYGIIIVFIGVPIFGFLFVGFCASDILFKEPQKHYIDLLIKRIDNLCSQYKGNLKNDIMEKTIYQLQKELKTIGFYICDKNCYKGEIAENYLKFFEERITHKVIKPLQKEKETIQNIDSLFEKTKTPQRINNEKSRYKAYRKSNESSF